jgi:hypothetical protein
VAQPASAEPPELLLDVPLEEPLEAPPDEPLEAPLEVPPDDPLDAPFEDPLEAPFDEPLEAPFEEPLELEVPLDELTVASGGSMTVVPTAAPSGGAEVMTPFMISLGSAQ